MLSGSEWSRGIPTHAIGQVNASSACFSVVVQGLEHFQDIYSLVYTAVGSATGVIPPSAIALYPIHLLNLKPDSSSYDVLSVVATSDLAIGPRPKVQTGRVDIRASDTSRRVNVTNSQLFLSSIRNTASRIQIFHCLWSMKLTKRCAGTFFILLQSMLPTIALSQNAGRPSLAESGARC